MKRISLLIALLLVCFTAPAEFLGEFQVSETFSISANTHEATSGLAADADALPTYRVYGATSTTPLATGTLALFDGANTIGYYRSNIVMDTTNYPVGRFHIYIQAVVNNVTGSQSHTFLVRDDSASVAEIPWSVTVETATNAPIPDVHVWISTDTASNEVIASGYTNDNGIVTFRLNPGIKVYVWKRKAGWNFTNPTSYTVAAQ